MKRGGHYDDGGPPPPPKPEPPVQPPARGDERERKWAGRWESWAVKRQTKAVR